VYGVVNIDLQFLMCTRHLHLCIVWRMS